jgi:hypothetical protein
VLYSSRRSACAHSVRACMTSQCAEPSVALVWFIHYKVALCCRLQMLTTLPLDCWPTLHVLSSTRGTAYIMQPSMQHNNVLGVPRTWAHIRTIALTVSALPSPFAPRGAA